MNANTEKKNTHKFNVLDDLAGIERDFIFIGCKQSKFKFHGKKMKLEISLNELLHFT